MHSCTCLLGAVLSSPKIRKSRASFWLHPSFQVWKRRCLHLKTTQAVFCKSKEAAGGGERRTFEELMVICAHLWDFFKDRYNLRALLCFVSHKCNIKMDLTASVSYCFGSWIKWEQGAKLLLVWIFQSSKLLNKASPVESHFTSRAAAAP